MSTDLKLQLKELYYLSPCNGPSQYLKQGGILCLSWIEEGTFILCNFKYCFLIESWVLHHIPQILDHIALLSDDLISDRHLELELLEYAIRPSYETSNTPVHELDVSLPVIGRLVNERCSRSSKTQRSCTVPFHPRFSVGSQTDKPHWHRCLSCTLPQLLHFPSRSPEYSASFRSTPAARRKSDHLLEDGWTWTKRRLTGLTAF